MIIWREVLAVGFSECSDSCNWACPRQGSWKRHLWSGHEKCCFCWSWGFLAEDGPYPHKCGYCLSCHPGPHTVPGSWDGLLRRLFPLKLSSWCQFPAYLDFKCKLQLLCGSECFIGATKTLWCMRQATPGMCCHRH